MNFLLDINNNDKWVAFLNEKLSDIYATNGEIKKLNEFLDNKNYLSFSNWINSKKYLTTPITKKDLMVSGKDKRRTVYCYDHKYIDYQYFFKYINYLLKEYDYIFSKNLYSFRSGYKIGNAVRKLTNKNIYSQYKAKLDIHDYFRSIDINKLIPKVEKIIDDQDFINFLKDYLSIHTFKKRGKMINDIAGVFPGNPISGFLSNLYLSEMDTIFDKTNVNYFRYADDILLCSPNEEQLKSAVNKVELYLKEYGLEINPKKKEFFLPNKDYHFLGLAFTKKGVTISEETIHKIKGKIRRSARKILRWCIKRQVKREIGVKIFIKKYNSKFFGIVPGEQSWIHWYLPYIHDDSILKEVDRYFYQEARYIMSGNHNKKSYKLLPYEKLKELGYISLVREYHRLAKKV